MPLPLRPLAIGVALYGAAAVSASAGCQSYEAPCRVVAAAIVASDIGGDASLQRRTNDGGETDVRWFRAADPATPPALSHVPAALEVLTIADDGQLVGKRTVSAPASLAGRRGNTGLVSAAWTGGGALYTWTETTAEATGADGVTPFEVRLRMQYVDEAGREGPLLDLPNATCRGCTVRTSTGVTAEGVTVLYLRAPIAGAKGAPEKAEATFVLISPSGVVAAEGSVPWTLARAPAGGLGTIGSTTPSLGGNRPRLESVGGLLILRTDGGAWLVDARLTPTAGPFAIDDARISWSASGELVTAHAAARTEGAAAPVGGESDVLFQRYAQSGVPLARASRIGTGTLVDALAAGAGGYGVVFTSDHARYFARLDAEGHKIGGDVELAPPSLAGAATEAPTSTVGSAAPLLEQLSSHGDRFVRLSIEGGRVTRQELSCAP